MLHETPLLLDFDSPVVPRDFSQRLLFIQQVLSVRPEFVRIDRTRQGWHGVVQLPKEFPPLGVVALQSILGSDWKREGFNLLRALYWKDTPKFWRNGRWNVLYSSHTRGISL